MKKPALKVWAEKLFRYRWAIGLLILILAVALEINGSSLGMWNVHIPNGNDPKTDILVGPNRAIRSDEWCIFTPMAMSQYYNDFGLTSDVLRGTETDVFMVYGQPVRDWSIVFRPFQIGYLFLSQGQGLSFYWMGKMIVLFLVSIEFGLLLTKKKKGLSIAWGFLVTLAPIVQWWFSTNAFPDMLIYGQGIMLFLNGYMENTSYKKRALFALGLSWLCGCYLLVIYPAWQIPFFYVFLAIGLWVILSHRREFSFSWKKDLPLLGGAVVLLVLCMGVIIHRSWNAIQTVMNSVYPGARMETGGRGLATLFRYPGNIWFPFVADNVPINQCESAVFFDFFPLGLLGAALGFRQKKKDGLTIALLIALVFLGFYAIVGFPAWLAKITLLSNCQADRVAVAVSFLNLLLLFRALGLAEEEKLRFPLGAGIGAGLALGIGMLFLSRALVYESYLTVKMLLVCAAVMACLFVLAFTHRRAFCIAVCVLSLGIGATVNPVRRGVSALTETVPAKAVRELASESGGKWLAVSEDWTAGNFLIANGAHTLNNTNTYVNRDFWKVLDPEGNYEQIYNRYAQISVGLTPSEEPAVQLISPDLIRAAVPVSLLKDLGVEYLFTNEDLYYYETETVRFEPVFFDENTPYLIYRLEDTSGAE